MSLLTNNSESERGWFLRALVVSVLMVISVAVTMPAQEFSNGGENLVLSTATETRRTGHWLVPTMNSVPRINKPPLPMWLSAIGITDDTMAGLSSHDAAVREAAYLKLGMQTRWPALLASGLAVLVAFELGRTLSNRSGKIGWMAAAICASEILFLRNARNATTDVQLMLWVGVANLLIAKALFEGWRWVGSIGAGAAIGLAMMSKGPVALAQSVVPLMALWAWDCWSVRKNWPLKRPVRWKWGPVLAGTAAALLIGLPWYLMIRITDPAVTKYWWMEVTREGATDMPASRWWAYVIFLPWLAPWTVFFIAGVATAITEARAIPLDEPSERRSRGLLMAVLLVIVPILVMSLFRDRKDRYTLPMFIPAAVVAALGIRAYYVARREGQTIGWLAGIHWLVLAAMAIGFPIAGAMGVGSLKTLSGEPWYSWPLAISAAGTAAAVLIAAIFWERRLGRGLVGVTTLVLFGLQIVFLIGYRQSDEGRSEMKPLADQIWAKYPDANVRIAGKRRLPTPPDLPIYLNRPVSWENNPEKLEQGDRPWVIVIRQRHDDPVAPTAPPGWIALTPVPRDRNMWHAFALPAK